MKIIKTIKEMQRYSFDINRSGKQIALVPTMGFLHKGHLSLIDKAHKNADIVIVSIFINPTQFAPNEDLASYPKDLENDLKLCKERTVDVIFLPRVENIYPSDSSTWVTEEKLSEGLCGTTRPTHFRGVTTIVTKLFNATLPNIAIFGKKDFQQAAIIQRMVRDLNFPIKIVTAPIVREEDGLAMSSRNKYLTCEERKQAPIIQKTLQEASFAICADKEKNSINVDLIKDNIKLRISQNGGNVDYIEIVDPVTLESKLNFNGDTLIAVAVYYGKTRLLDNIVCKSRTSPQTTRYKS